MLSCLVYAAAARVSNRFELCASVALATRKLHVSSTPVGTTIGRVLNTVASEKQSEAIETLFDSGEIRLVAKQRMGVNLKEKHELEVWGSGLSNSMPLSDLHRVLAGMK